MRVEVKPALLRWARERAQHTPWICSRHAAPFSLPRRRLARLRLTDDEESCNSLA